MMPLQSTPGQIQQRTPLWLEHVPDRFCEQEYVLSLHMAVAVPQLAWMGLLTLQMLPEGGGRDGEREKSRVVFAVRVTVWSWDA